jgi:hypothetical protein
MTCWSGGYIGCAAISKSKHGCNKTGSSPKAQQGTYRPTNYLLLAVQETLQIYEVDKFDNFCLIMSTIFCRCGLFLIFVLHLQISSVSMQTPELSGRKHSGETNSGTVSSLVGNMHGTEPAMKKQRQDNRRRI